MQEVQMTSPIGTQLQGRYVIEDLLGQGGFSAVYIVKDRKLGGKRFAVKELKNQSKAERERFLFECEILKRLHHPALPTVSHLFEENNQTYMLMEYIDGSNLEKLRKQQVGERFTLAEVLILLTSIVNAVSYLHKQPIPVLHRDIKPANIVLKEQGKAVLVDFGIAKEYHPDTTTTAIRHCSAGYSAPEQYSGVGTDTRGDVYSLGATCYALLTGTVPMDALQRTTMFVTKGKDPLPPLNELVPEISIQVTRVLQQAMAISAERRYATVSAFWQALNAAAILPPMIPASEKQKVVPQEPRALVTPMGKSHWRIIVPVIILVALLLGGGIPLTTFLISKHTTRVTTVQQAGKKVANTVVPIIQPELVRQYKGTIHDLLAKTSTEMTLTQVHQSGQVIDGTFSGIARQSTFAGVRDTSKHLFFTIAPSQGQSSLFFEGSMRGDGNLVGNYCRQDTSGQCIGDYGIWSVMPFFN